MPDTIQGDVANSKANVSTTRGVEGGYMFTAPVGTAFPTVFDAIGGAWANEGFISSDGFVEHLDGSNSNIGDMNGDTVDTYGDSKTETMALTLMEMAKNPLKMQYGSQNVSVAGDGTITVHHNWSRAEDHWAVILDLLLKDGRRWRKLIPDCKVSELGDFTGNSTTATGRQITLTYLKGDNGDTCVDVIQAAPGTAADCTLSALTLGVLRLTPTFSPSVTEYTASTTNSTNTVNAVATDEDATVAIKLGATDVTNGAAATWATGENELAITVTNGGSSKVYTVAVTKS